MTCPSADRAARALGLQEARHTPDEGGTKGDQTKGAWRRLDYVPYYIHLIKAATNEEGRENSR